MTDRTNLDVAAEAIQKHYQGFIEAPTPAFVRDDARAALDAIHPALADLTPEDIAAIFDYLRWRKETVGPSGWVGPINNIPAHTWKVLSR